MRAPSAAVLALLVLASGACRAPEPKAELELTDVETYWVIDSALGMTEYIAPAVRFRLRNRGARPWGGIQATATFRRKGEESQTWGSDWRQVTTSAKPLAPGQDTLVVLKSDGRYYSTGTPESMFQHHLFKDAKVEVYLRIGASGWVKFTEADIERRIGSKAVQAGPSS
jgi:hypothetical protein